MSRGCFKQLCTKIEEVIGEDVFKSEEYIKGLEDGTRGTALHQKMHKAHMKLDGGFLSGQTKVAIALRMLAGGSYLDLAMIFDISVIEPARILHQFCCWVNNDLFFSLDGGSYIMNLEQMRKVAHGFMTKSNGIFKGCIGAIDGWLVKIIKPSLSDGITNAGDFFQGKIFTVLMCRWYVIVTSV